MEVRVLVHDAVIIGGGLAGMRAAIEAGKEADVALLSKVHPLRAHSNAAQGGIACVLEKDDLLESHIYDTVKGSDFLGDQDAIEILCSEAPENIQELDRMGVIFSRMDDGSIAQREFGGHSFPRACYAADRTGHAILHAMYEQLLKNRITVYPEWYVLSLIMNDGACCGITAHDIGKGETHIIRAKAVMFATGGYGTAYATTTNAFASTGDGCGIASRAGVPLMDMEFVQFHPTGLYPRGLLITEGARGEGGILINDKGERFMKRYANAMELAPRDVVVRAMQKEMDEGRGIGGANYLYLDLTHIGREKIMERLPQIHEIALNFAGVDCAEEPIPVTPSVHYSMGGIPVNHSGEVEGIKGLFAAGECSCVSVHGANRLGCNSLLEAVVFGRRAGRELSRYVRKAKLGSLPETDGSKEIENILDSDGNEKVPDLRETLRKVMMEKCGIFRDRKGLQEGLKAVKELQKRFENIYISDKGRVFNTAFIEAAELHNLLTISEIIVHSALVREESRGSHTRTDYPERDDARWLKHTLAHRTGDGLSFSYRPVTITRFHPEKRKH